MSKLVVTGHTSQIAQKLFEKVRQLQPDVRIVTCGRASEADRKVDFGSYASMRDFRNWLTEEAPQYLFLNHGILPGKRLHELSDAEVDQSVRVNLVSYALILEALPNLPGLRTVVMSSISGKTGSFDTLYAGCKAGIDALMAATAANLSPSSRLNAVSPGIIEDARMTTQRTDHEVLQSKKKRTPTKKFTTSEEIAGLVHYLLFDSENIQGENINVNGGLFIGP